MTRLSFKPPTKLTHTSFHPFCSAMRLAGLLAMGLPAPSMDPHVTREGEKIREFPKIKCSVEDVMSTSPPPVPPRSRLARASEHDAMALEIPRGVLRCVWQGGVATTYAFEAGTVTLVRVVL